MEIQHKGWDWDAVKSESWNEISEEFLPVALSWVSAGPQQNTARPQ